MFQRLKFLKSARAEGAAVTDMVTRLSLGHPSVAFTLHLDERTTIDLPPHQSLKDRCADTIGRQIAEGLLPVEGVADVTQLQGFVAHPQYAKPSAKKQYVYLNGRPVQDRMITAAIREGFAGFLEPRLHGVVVLYLDTDPSLIDVNVHPTKAEIRFRRQGEVFALLRDSIKKVLAEHSGGFRLDGVAGAAPGGQSGLKVAKAALNGTPLKAQPQQAQSPESPPSRNDFSRVSPSPMARPQ